MGLFSIIKKNSRLALKGNWGRAIVILIIMGSVSLLITVVTQMAMTMFVPPQAWNAAEQVETYSDLMQFAEGYRISAAEWIVYGVSTLLSILLISPLALGAARWYYRLVHGENLSVTELFFYFERGRSYLRAIFYEINLGIRSLLWMLVFYAVPSVILGIATFFLSGDAELTRAGTTTATLGILLAVVLFLLATLFYAACLCRYTLTPYLMADNADLTVRQAIKLSVKYTRGFRFQILWFLLSYIGWFLLLIFIWPTLYVTPYYSTGIAMYSRYLIEKNRSMPAEVTQEFSAELPHEAAPEPEVPEDSPEIAEPDEENRTVE